MEYDTEKEFCAEEARKLTDSSRNVSMKPIFDKIKKSAQNGDVNVNFDLTDNQSKYVDIIIKKLESLGYKVSRQNGYDQRENTSWDYLYINWK